MTAETQSMSPGILSALGPDIPAVALALEQTSRSPGIGHNEATAERRATKKVTFSL